MSSVSEEDDSGPSLKELVTKSLEANGILGKLQAQLRASVFLILEEDCMEKNIPLVNKEDLELLSTPSGKIAVSLIQDFLQCLHLDFTLSVFNPESKCSSSSKNFIDREDLEEKFNVKLSEKNKNYPFLLRLIENFMKQSQIEGEDSKQKSTSSSLNGIFPKISNGYSHSEDFHGSNNNKLDSNSRNDGGHGLGNKEQMNDQNVQLEKAKEQAEHHNSNGLPEHDSDKEDSLSPGISNGSSLSEKDTLAGLEKEYEEEDFSSLSNLNNLPLNEERQQQAVSEEAKNSKNINDAIRPSQDSSQMNGDSKANDVAKNSANSHNDKTSLSEDIEEELDDLLSTDSEITNQTKDISLSKKDNNSSLVDYQESL